MTAIRNIKNRSHSSSSRGNGNNKLVKGNKQNRSDGGGEVGFSLKLILPTVISVITFICFSYTLKCGFVHWDDQVYVYENPFIKSFSAQNLKMLLFHVTTAGNFHPLTMLSLAINYHFSGLSPMGYHLTNIILHIMNTILVFVLFVRLFEAMRKAAYPWFDSDRRLSQTNGEGNSIIFWLAALAALWHGIHPMHVESVAWISERKDLLYALFYFSGIIVYLKYLESKTVTIYFFLLALFLLSLLAKPGAVVFPLTLFAIDYLLKKPFSKRAVEEKIPFFILSLLVGIYTYSLQSSQGAMTASFDTFSFGQRILFSTYTFMMYIIKAVIPVHLSNFYPYPRTGASGMLPAAYLLSPLADVIIVGLPLYLAGKAGEDYKRLVTAGFLFYFFNVVLILKFVTVGGSIINDRYSYVAYTGLFLIAVIATNELFRKFKSMRYPFIAFLSLYSVLLCTACYSRTRVWYSTQTLWEDMKDKFPMTIEDPYSELAEYYRTQGVVNPAYYDSALANYEILKNNWRPKSAGIFSNMANIYALKKDYAKAFESYSKAIEYQPSDTNAYLNRALTFMDMNQSRLALPDLDKAIMLDSNLVQAVQNRAYVNYLTGNYIESIADYNHLIRLNGSRNGEFLYDISINYRILKKNAEAITYAEKAKQAGYSLPVGYLESMK